MPGKKAILKSIQGNKPMATSLPETYPVIGVKTNTGLQERFKTSLQIAGADVVELYGKAEVQDYIQKHCPSAIDINEKKNWAKYGLGCPKDKLDRIGTVILNGKFGVNENGAVWIDDSCFPNRLISFIAEKLIICLKKNELVANMHEAYQKIKLDDSGFGVFISGPSKTADIEQSLVYGAHGAKELTVLIY